MNCVEALSENKIVSCSDDKQIKIWNLTDQTCIKTVEGHYAKINCILLN